MIHIDQDISGMQGVIRTIITDYPNGAHQQVRVGEGGYNTYNTRDEIQFVFHQGQYKVRYIRTHDGLEIDVPLEDPF